MVSVSYAGLWVSAALHYFVEAIIKTLETFVWVILALLIITL
jgi:hypothetical protein